MQSASRTALQDVLEGKIGNIDDESGVLRIVRRIIADKVAAKLKQIRTAKRDRFRLARLAGRRTRTSSLSHEFSDGEREDLSDERIFFVAVHGRQNCSWLIWRQPIACPHHGRSPTGRLPTMC